ncbi:MAG: hypothetical protein V1911_02240, partial [Candidatus Micrarchaeota archaeon]
MTLAQGYASASGWYDTNIVCRAQLEISGSAPSGSTVQIETADIDYLLAACNETDNADLNSLRVADSNEAEMPIYYSGASTEANVFFKSAGTGTYYLYFTGSGSGTTPTSNKFTPAQTSSGYFSPANCGGSSCNNAKNGGVFGLSSPPGFWMTSSSRMNYYVSKIEVNVWYWVNHAGTLNTGIYNKTGSVTQLGGNGGTVCQPEFADTNAGSNECTGGFLNYLGGWYTCPSANTFAKSCTVNGTAENYVLPSSNDSGYIETDHQGSSSVSVFEVGYRYWYVVPAAFASVVSVEHYEPPVIAVVTLPFQPEGGAGSNDAGSGSGAGGSGPVGANPVSPLAAAAGAAALAAAAIFGMKWDSRKKALLEMKRQAYANGYDSEFEKGQAEARAGLSAFTGIGRTTQAGLLGYMQSYKKAASDYARDNLSAVPKKLMNAVKSAASKGGKSGLFSSYDYVNYRLQNKSKYEKQLDSDAVGEVNSAGQFVFMSKARMEKEWLAKNQPVMNGFSEPVGSAAYLRQQERQAKITEARMLRIPNANYLKLDEYKTALTVAKPGLTGGILEDVWNGIVGLAKGIGKFLESVPGVSGIYTFGERIGRYIANKWNVGAYGEVGEIINGYKVGKESVNIDYPYINDDTYALFG